MYQNVNLTIKNKVEIQERLRMIESSKGIDALEVLLAPDGSIKDEFNYLYQKATK